MQAAAHAAASAASAHGVARFLQHDEAVRLAAGGQHSSSDTRERRAPAPKPVNTVRHAALEAALLETWQPQPSRHNTPFASWPPTVALKQLPVHSTADDDSGRRLCASARLELTVAFHGLRLPSVPEGLSLGGLTLPSPRGPPPPPPCQPIALLLSAPKGARSADDECELSITATA